MANTQDFCCIPIVKHGVDGNGGPRDRHYRVGLLESRGDPLLGVETEFTCVCACCGGKPLFLPVLLGCKAMFSSS